MFTDCLWVPILRLAEDQFNAGRTTTVLTRLVLFGASGPDPCKDQAVSEAQRNRL